MAPDLFMTSPAQQERRTEEELLLWSDRTDSVRPSAAVRPLGWMDGGGGCSKGPLDLTLSCAAAATQPFLKSFQSTRLVAQRPPDYELTVSRCEEEYFKSLEIALQKW